MCESGVHDKTEELTIRAKDNQARDAKNVMTRSGLGQFCG